MQLPGNLPSQGPGPAYALLPTAYALLPAAYALLPAAYALLPAASAVTGFTQQTVAGGMLCRF